MLWDAGVKNFIFSIYLGDQKEDLEYCLTGYYENFGYEEKRGFSFEEEEEKEESEEKKKTRTIGIGVAGCIKRMGTTTQALQLVKYLQFVGFKAAYFQMNASNFVEAVKDAYEQVTVDDEIGLVSYAKVDMFCRTDRLQEVLNLDYDYWCLIMVWRARMVLTKFLFWKKNNRFLWLAVNRVVSLKKLMM